MWATTAGALIALPFAPQIADLISGQELDPGLVRIAIGGLWVLTLYEYLVTLFVHPVDIETAPLRIFNLQKTGGLSPATAALAVTMQLVSFAAVLVFFRVFGTRHFKGTYIL